MPARRKRGRPPYPDLLTPAEWRVVHAVQHGMTNREIAKRRGISIDAVKYHVANVMAKLGMPHRKALRQWFRAPGHSALGASQNAGGGLSMLGPLAQISRAVRDVAEAEAWYRNVLGLKHLYTFGDLAFFDLGGTRLFLTQQENPSPAESILYLRVDDIAKACEDLKSRGVAFRNAPHMIHRHEDGTEEWVAFFDDPEGRPLAIMAQVRKVEPS
jgi:DNA-binding CsgD family transcriptional regulator/catechol 2,3-dioxygenase-like lactoylglutathione lyase family enzyme